MVQLAKIVFPMFGPQKGSQLLNNPSLDLLADIKFCLFNIICRKGLSDRKSDCGRNSISTTGNIEMLHFSGKLNSGGIERDSGANTRDSGVNGRSDFF